MWSQSFLVAVDKKKLPSCFSLLFSSQIVNSLIFFFFFSSEDPKISLLYPEYVAHNWDQSHQATLKPLSILTFLFNGFLLDKANSISDLQRYTDTNNGFTLLIPSSWIKVEKAGANALFEEPNNGSNSIGVVVSPVRIKSLKDFGTPQFVADKLINAEERKESTKEAEVVSVGERSGGLQNQVYEFEYKIDSTRGGIKRVFSAAFVSSNKLYLLNVVHSDKPENPLDSSTRLLLELVLHSFDALPL